MYAAKEHGALLTASDLAIEFSLHLRQEAEKTATFLQSLRSASEQAISEAKNQRSLINPHSKTNYLWGNLPLTSLERLEARFLWLDLMASDSLLQPDEVECLLKETPLPIHDAITTAIVIFVIERPNYLPGKTPFD